MHTLGLKFDETLVRVSAADRGDLDWLARFFACGFEQSDAETPTDEVRLTIDPHRNAALLEGGPGMHPAPLEGFAFDNEPGPPLQPWGVDGDTATFHDPRLKGFYLWSEAQRRLEILASARTPRLRHTLMRAVRELTMDRALDTGGVILHAAAVIGERGAIVIAGPKRHGKTTLLLSLLASTEASYLSNDRCILRVRGAEAIVRGLATIVSLRRDLLDRLPAMRDRLFAALPGFAADQATGLAPDELTEALSLRTSSAGGLAAVLFPIITDHAARLQVRRLSPSDARPLFREGLFRAGHPSVLGDVFVSASNRGRSAWDTAEPTARWVSEHVPCYRVELGGNALPTSAETRTLLTL